MAKTRSTLKPQKRSHAPARSRPFAGARQGAALAAAVVAALQGLAAEPARAEPMCGGATGKIEDAQTMVCVLGVDDLELTVTASGSVALTEDNAVRVMGNNVKVVNHGHLDTGTEFGFAAFVNNEASGTSLTNTGTIEGPIAVSNRPDSSLATLNNSGTLIGHKTAAIRNEGVIDSLVNSGTVKLVSGDQAIQNWGQLGTLTNTGVISGAGNTVIVNSTTLDKLVNDGTIHGQQNAIVNEMGGTIGEIVNTGTIRTADPAMYAIQNGAAITRGITNSGLLDGRVHLGSATLYLEGSQGRVTGEVSGTADSAVVVGGQFTTEAGFFVDRFSVKKGGHLTIRDGHTIEVHEGAFQNKGTVAILPGETAYISGDYIQSSDASLLVGATSVSEHGKLLVKGHASFEPGTKLVVAVSKTNTLANQNVMASVIEAGSLEATGDTFIVGDDSELFDFKATVNDDNTVDLLTVLDENPDDGKGDGDGGGGDGGGSDGGAGGGSGGSKGGAISNRVSAQGFSQGLGASRILDGFVASPGNAGDLAEVVTAFGKLGSQAEVVDAVAQTLPLMSANLNQVTLGSMQGVNRVIQARQGGLGGMSSGDGFLADKHLWFKPLASYADQDDRDGVAGYRANTYGFLFGGDAVVGKAGRLGLAFSYARTDVDGKSMARYNSADVDAYQVIAYGSHSIAAWPDVEVNWQADFGLNSNEGRRTMRFGGLDRTAKSDFDSTTAHVGAGISKGLQVREATRLTPALRLDYFRIHNESYTEKGADTLNLRVKSQTSEQLIAMLEGRVQHRLNERMALGASLGVGYDLIGDRDSVTASYVGGGAAFNTPGMKASRWLGRAGLGLSYQASEATEIAARYDLEGRDGFLAQTASVNVRWAF